MVEEGYLLGAEGRLGGVEGWFFQALMYYYVQGLGDSEEEGEEVGF